MTNEWNEFKAYTEKPVYSAAAKRDTSFLGRFSFATIHDFEGLGRILTIIARGYLFHNADGSLKNGDPYARVEDARNALLAWCSIPDKKKESDPPVDFRHLYDRFPELVTADGEGWFYRHVHGILRFVKSNLDKTSVDTQKKCAALSKGFNTRWKNKVRQLQVPIFALNTKGAWVLRFDGILANTLEQGSLRMETFALPQKIADKLKGTDLNGVPFQVMSDVTSYYLANRRDNTDWVTLPISAFDCLYRNTNFSHKWLSRIPEAIMERQSCCDVCRIQIKVTNQISSSST